LTRSSALCRRVGAMLLSAACSMLAGIAVAQQSGLPDGIKITGGLAVDDVPGSFARGAALAAGCLKPPGNSSAAPTLMNAEMVIVDTWRRSSGDIEGISHVTPTDGGNVRIINSSREFASDADTEGKPKVSSRLLCAADLADSQAYNTGYGEGYPDIFPGTTQFSLSAVTLHLLRTAGDAPLDYIHYEFMSPPGLYVPFQFSGILHRVETADVPYPLIVDGKPVTLAAVHVKGVFEFSGPESLRVQIPPDRIKQVVEFYVLDDESRPISLLYKFGPQFQIQVASIVYPKHTPQNALEHQLLADKHAVVYGIYFDFNSDHVRAESQPVLKEIADAMSHYPDWKLSIDGHTDNIGGDTKNLDLSRRRAEAVRRALVEQYHLSGGRMTTSGYGASRPVDTNDTLSGRARNRRVELTRQ
jgi:outer membrane protein OmpA-like peptidoglycan-associated protein